MVCIFNIIGSETSLKLMSENSEVFRKVLKIEGMDKLMTLIMKKFERVGKVGKSNLEEFKQNLLSKSDETFQKLEQISK